MINWRVAKNSDGSSSLLELINSDYIVFMCSLLYGQALPIINFGVNSNTLGVEVGKIDWNLLNDFSYNDGFGGQRVASNLMLGIENVKIGTRQIRLASVNIVTMKTYRPTLLEIYRQ